MRIDIHDHGSRLLSAAVAEPDDGGVSHIALAPSGQKKMRAEHRASRDRVKDLLEGWPRKDQFAFGAATRELNDAIGDLELPSRQSRLGASTSRHLRRPLRGPTASRHSR